MVHDAVPGKRPHLGPGLGDESLELNVCGQGGRQ